MTSESWIGAVALGVVISGIASFVLWRSLVERLESTHQEAWVDLGKPSIATGFDLRTSWVVFRFFWSGEHRRLNDRELDRSARGAIATLIAMQVLVAVGIVARAIT